MTSAGSAGDPRSSTWASNCTTSAANNGQTTPAVTSVTGGWQSSSTCPVDVSNYTAPILSGLQAAWPDGRQDSVDGSTHVSATVHGVLPWALSNVKSQADAFTFSDRDVQHADQSHGYFQPEIEQGWDTAFQSLVEPDSTVCGPTMPTSNWDYKSTSNPTELQRFNAHSCQETTPTSKPQEGKSADDSPRQEPKDAGDGFQSATQGNIINARANHRAATSPDETIYQPQLHLRRETDKLHVQYVSGTHTKQFRYRCPLPSCGEVFGSSVTRSQFVRHTMSHAIDFGKLDLNVCQFGCQQGFMDALARWTEHYQGNQCFEPDLLTGRGEMCGYTGCRYPQKANDAGGTHWVDRHGAEAYHDSNVPFKDDVCRLGFRTKDALFCHYKGTKHNTNTANGEPRPQDVSRDSADAPGVEGVLERAWRWAINRVFGIFAKRMARGS